MSIDLEAFMYKDGNRADFVAAADQEAGDILKIGASAIVGVVAKDVESGADGVMQLNGIFSVVKNTSTAFVVGAEVEWDDTAKEAVAATTGDFDIGTCLVAAAAADERVILVLNRY